MPGKPRLFETHVLLPPTPESRARILLETLRLVGYLYDTPLARARGAAPGRGRGRLEAGRGDHPAGRGRQCRAAPLLRHRRRRGGGQGRPPPAGPARQGGQLRGVGDQPPAGVPHGGCGGHAPVPVPPVHGGPVLVADRAPAGGPGADQPDPVARAPVGGGAAAGAASGRPHAVGGSPAPGAPDDQPAGRLRPVQRAADLPAGGADPHRRRTGGRLLRPLVRAPPGDRGRPTRRRAERRRWVRRDGSADRRHTRGDDHGRLRGRRRTVHECARLPGHARGGARLRLGRVDDGGQPAPGRPSGARREEPG